MSTVCFVLLVFLALGIFPSCQVGLSQDYQGFCSDYSSPPSSCTLHYDPVCGSDGKTYGNKCAFCREVFEKLGSLCFKWYGEC